jgi:DNA-binding IclR family transcriptional regulator
VARIRAAPKLSYPPIEEWIQVPESPTRVLSKARAVLDCFLPDNRPMTLTEVANATGLPLTTAQRLLRSLVAEEFVARTETGYRLGLGLIGWASAARRGLTVVDAARVGMDALRDATGETVTLLVREGLQRICVAASPSRHVISQRSEPGEVARLQAGSPSKVLLAWDPETTQSVLARGLVPLASNTITDPEQLVRELAEVREVGYATSCNENAEGVASIGVPVFDGAGRVIAALCLGGPASRVTPEWLAAHRDEVLALARQVSRGMGWSGTVSATVRVPSAR